MDAIARLGMSPRQQELNRLWSHYQCAQYDGRKTRWDGSEATDALTHEAIASATYLPAGFVDAGGSNLPLAFRRPTAPYNLFKVIVDRFTGLLISERRHPKLRAADNKVAEEWLHALSETARLWPAVMQARNFGGATGTAVAGFQLVRGKPVIEVHDPRWMFPTFKDRWALKLAAVEKRMMYPVEVEEGRIGHWKTKWYWYRRVIDANVDVVFKPAEVRDEEPEWEEQTRVEHGLGFCPVVWAQNLPVQDDIDGLPDCHGIIDTLEAIDGLLAQAHRGTIANSDPTLIVAATLAQGESLKKGSGNAIVLPPGGSAEYLELTGAAAEAALKLVEQLRKNALEVAQCVLDHPDVAQKTAVEVERVYSSMLAKADVLREQYGEKFIKPLMKMMLRAGAKVGQGATSVGGDGQPKVERGGLRLQGLRTIKRGPNGLVVQPPMEGVEIELQWPPYFEPGLNDLQIAVTATVAARTGQLIDVESAVKYVADYFHIEDVQKVLAQLQTEKQQDDLAQQSLAALQGGTPSPAPMAGDQPQEVAEDGAPLPPDDPAYAGDEPPPDEEPEVKPKPLFPGGRSPGDPPKNPSKKRAPRA